MPKESHLFRRLLVFKQILNISPQGLYTVVHLDLVLFVDGWMGGWMVLVCCLQSQSPQSAFKLHANQDEWNICMESSWCSHKYKNNVLILCKYWARILNELWLCLHHQLFLISRASVTAKCVAGIKYSKVHFWIVCKKKNCNVGLSGDIFFSQRCKTAKDAVTNIYRCLRSKWW